MLKYLIGIDPKIIENFTWIGWFVALLALFAKFDWEKNGKKPIKWFGLFYDGLLISFVSISITISVQIIYDNSAISKLIEINKTLYEQIKILTESNNELKKNNFYLKSFAEKLEIENENLKKNIEKITNLNENNNLYTHFKKRCESKGLNQQFDETENISKIFGHHVSSVGKFVVDMREGDVRISIECDGIRYCRCR